VATVLSAQSTDKAVNQITPALFARYPTPEALAKANTGDVEALLARIGMFRQKTKNIVGLARGLVERHGGKVPEKLDQLVALPGVGRKTANVVLGVAFGKSEGVVVDTHVQRISQRLGWTRETSPEGIEPDLMRLFPQGDWDMVAHVLIFHGRRICFAQRPACTTCGVRDVCPSAGRAENVGRKAPRTRAPAPPAKAPAKSGKTAAAKTAAAKTPPAKSPAATKRRVVTPTRGAAPAPGTRRSAPRS
jgi:endonuclease III